MTCNEINVQRGGVYLPAGHFSGCLAVGLHDSERTNTLGGVNLSKYGLDPYH
jgi:hypothetical protein